jgi:hypothetical protein
MRLFPRAVVCATRVACGLNYGFYSIARGKTMKAGGA